MSPGERLDMSSIGTPSTTYRGSLLACTDVAPLTLMDNDVPGMPEGWITCTPAALPCKAEAAETMGLESISSVETTDTAVVMSLLWIVP